LTKLSDISRSVSIQISDNLNFKLRDLTLRDIETIQLLDNGDLNAREFCVAVLDNQLVNEAGYNANLRGALDAQILEIGFQWVNEIGSEALSSSDERSFETLAADIRQLVQGIQKNIGEIVKSFATAGLAMASTIQASMIGLSSISRWRGEQLRAVQSLADSVQNAAYAITAATANLAKGFVDVAGHLAQSLHGSVPSLSSFLTNLPDVDELRKWARIAALARKRVGESDYGYIVHLLYSRDLIGLAGDQSRSLEPHITNRLVSITRAQPFETTLQTIFEHNVFLKRRWPIVLRAVREHRRRNYLMSIPPLISQTEGVFTDLMELRKLVTVKSGKCYVKDAHGGIKKITRKDGSLVPETISGLVGKIQRSRYKSDPILASLVEKFLHEFCPERNSILHGSKTSYGNAKLSTRLLLSLLVLARIISSDD
jgi:hypothetical protein